MKNFAARRLTNLSLLMLASVLIVGANLLVHAALNQSSFLSGWLLLGSVIALMLFNARKKLPFLPIGRGSSWLQFHVYLGLFALVIFLVHVDFAMPSGLLERTLATLFAVVAGSGVAGIWLSRVIPKRLSSRGEEVIFERIPAYREQIKRDVEALVEKALAQTQSVTIGEFYRGTLRDFLSAPRNLMAHLWQSNRPLRAIERDIRALERYLSPEESDLLAHIAEQVRLKNDLDYHFAGQAVLKGWLFVHIPLTYSLLLFAVVHTLVVYAFVGGD